MYNVCFTTCIFARVFISFLNVLLICYYLYIHLSSHLGECSALQQEKVKVKFFCECHEGIWKVEV